MMTPDLGRLLKNERRIIAVVPDVEAAAKRIIPHQHPIEGSHLVSPQDDRRIRPMMHLEVLWNLTRWVNIFQKLEAP
jgi:hypothetical protein